MAKKKTHWSTLTIYDVEGNELSRVDAHAALAEYRETGAMAGRYFVDPEPYTPEAYDEASYEGPTVKQIDWSGFGAGG